ncbi:hypothetical protein BaRGS_00003655, partial [Batillaria attramentaria]
GALAGLLVSTVVSFWTGVGAAVVLPVPEVQRVDTAHCINRDLLHQQCVYGNVSDALNYTMDGATTDLTTLPPAKTILSSNLTTADGLSSGGTHGEDLWIYHISYQLYALFAVVIFIIVSTIVSLISSCFTGFNTPDDVDRTLVHKFVDRACCYLPLSCRRVPREKEKMRVIMIEDGALAIFLLPALRSANGRDAPWTVSDDIVVINGDATHRNGKDHSQRGPSKCLQAWSSSAFANNGPHRDMRPTFQSKSTPPEPKFCRQKVRAAL